MRINEYYRDTANLNLNGSIAALVPTVMIVAINLSIIKNREFMLMTLPFLIYSLISFQIYLYRIRQSIEISKNILEPKITNQSLFQVQHLLVFYLNTASSQVQLYRPDGNLAGVIKKYRKNGWKRLRFSKTFALYNYDEEVLGFFKVKGNKLIKIEVYDPHSRLLGSLEKTNLGWKKSQKKLFDGCGRYVGGIEGSSIFMDEQVLDIHQQQVGRLRRGWMPVEWSPLFPEPNTPVLSFMETLTENDQLLRMSFLINEYFIER